jgi:hypothetical protein
MVLPKKPKKLCHPQIHAGCPSSGEIFREGKAEDHTKFLQKRE